MEKIDLWISSFDRFQEIMPRSVALQNSHSLWHRDTAVLDKNGRLVLDARPAYPGVATLGICSTGRDGRIHTDCAEHTENKKSRMV